MELWYLCFFLAQSKVKARRRSQSIVNILKRSSIVSTISLTTQGGSETGDNLGTLDDLKKPSLLRLPFFFEILRLNGPEWFYIVIGGIASLIFGAVTPVSLFLLYTLGLHLSLIVCTGIFSCLY